MCSAVMLLRLGAFSFSPRPVSSHFPSNLHIHWSHVCLHTVCRPRRLRELPLHAFITWAIFVWATRLCSAGDKRGLERRSRCVGSARSCSVFFIWLGHGPGLISFSSFFFHLQLFSLPLSLHARQCVRQPAFLYLYVASVSGLTFIGSPSTACSSRSSSPSSGRNHVRVPPLTLLICPSTFQPLFFYFRTPTSALHHFRPTFPGCSPEMIGLVGCFFFSLSVCIPSFFPSLFLHKLSWLSFGRAES